jgi:DNA polymerase-3 subunit alpha
MQTGATLENDKRFRFEGDQFYLKSDAEMRERFRDLPEACDATAAIAQRISPKIESLEKSKQFHIPTFPLPEHKKIDPDGTPLTPEVYLRRLCLGGLNKRYGADNITREPRFRERMNYELGVIEEMRLSSYFLIVWDFIKYARDNGIPVGPGRGSAVGSIVAYCLAITAIDPLKYDLSFERFLNPGRRDSMPDIDTDFCIDGRDDVIAYVAHKYGAARVTGIVTFSEIKARNAIRDAGRMLGVPLGTVDRVAKLIPNGPGQRALGIAEAEHAIPELAQLVEADPATRALLETGKRLEGYIRNIGSHAAAVVIADDDITRYVPVVDFRKKSGSLSLNCQFDMRWVEELGLLKMDFLGLRNLTVMRAAQNAIRETSDPTFSVDDIPDDDTTTFEMLARGETSGVFQLESAGMRRAIVDLRPDSFADIVALVALYRPGPMEWIPQYISNKHGRTTPAYLHPKLEGILADTHGIAIFQEQITTIAREIAGYSFTEADKLRKVVGKKILAEVPAERAKFISGAVGSGTSATVAEAIFKFIEPFAGYGFGKSHAVAYGRISFQTAYLKAHYPGPYFAALLSSVNDKPDKLRDYMLDARRCGFTILPPDINESRSGFVARDKEIRFGFAAVRGITETSISDIVRERDRGGPYASVADLIRRTRSSGLQKRTVEALVKVGAFDRIGDERAAQLTALDTHFKSADHAIAQDAMGQGSLFGFEDLTTNVPPIRQLRASRAQLLAWEQEGLGMFVSGHPMDDVAPLVRARGALPIAEALRCPDTTRVLTAGLVTLMKRVLTRNGNPMIVAQIEDESGRIEIVIFPNKYLAQHESVCEGRMLFVTGSVRARAVRSGAPQDTDEGEDAEHAAEQKSIIVSGVEEITRETIVA